MAFLTIPKCLRTFGFNLYWIIFILPQLAMDIKRINDFGKDINGIFINLVQIFGWILWFICLDFGATVWGKNIYIEIDKFPEESKTLRWYYKF